VITHLGTVFVPVADQDAALGFYIGVLGFEPRGDWPYGGGAHRWVEVAPAGSTVALALVPPTEGRSAGGDVVRCAFGVTDLAVEHARLVAAGVAVDPLGPARPGLVSRDVTVEGLLPAQVAFRDPDGNRFLLVQT